MTNVTTVTRAEGARSSRLRYWRRVLQAYFSPKKSQLNFWHDCPSPNPHTVPGTLGEYYMLFSEKADYSGPFDAHGIPQLNYRGALGLQYNPIAIAQYGLGNFNAYLRNGDLFRRQRALAAAEWLVAALELNTHSVWVWHHNFDWEYRDLLVAPWYSGLAQGQGISLLVRAHAITSEPAYLRAAHAAFDSFVLDASEGGVSVRDADGNLWIEEYIVSPPTHILNGFIWASWGLYDFWLSTGEPQARWLFDQCIRTLTSNLAKYDAGYWSLYEQSGTWLPMLASPFYHRLHIAQLRVLFQLTREPDFLLTAEKWERYRLRTSNRRRAIAVKAAFKLCYY